MTKWLLQVMTLNLSGRFDPQTKQISATVSGNAEMNPVFGDKNQGKVTGTFKGAEVGGYLRGTWEATSDVSFLFQSKHTGRWETR